MARTVPRILVCTIAAALAAAAPAHAETDDQAQVNTDEQGRSTIRVSGQATERTPPERVEIELGVDTRASSAAQATADNARAARAVLSSLRAAIGKSDNVETVSYTLRPEWTTSKPGVAPSFAGYTATNVVRVTLDDVGEVGGVIDTAVRAGADVVNRVTYRLKDERAARARAMRAAIQDARAKAEVLARALDLRVRSVHSIVAVEPMPRPMYEARIARAVAATPIVAGPIETTATVTLTVDVAPAP